MKQQEVFKKIGTILKELNDQYKYLDNNEDQQNDLELELFVANAHFLADHSEVLRKLNQQKVIPPVIEQPAKKPEERYFEPLVQVKPPEPEPPAEVEASPNIEEPPPHIDLGSHGADDDFSFVRPEPEIIKHELVLDESQVWEDEDDNGFEIEEPVPNEEKPIESPPTKKPEPVKPAPVAEVKKEAPAVEHKIAAKHEEPKTKIETEEPLTINQMISAQLNKGKVAEQTHKQPVSDLKQAINLNDKLLYIKDLFNGYNLAYSEAIDILNRFSSFAEAEDFLKTNYAIKNHWDNKQATSDKFYELLKRRYS